MAASPPPRRKRLRVRVQDLCKVSHHQATRHPYSAILLTASVAGYENLVLGRGCS